VDNDSRYTTANLQVYLLRCIASMSKDFGIDPERLCMGLGFNLADLSDPDCRVSFRQASTMIRRAIEMTAWRGRGLGLDIGMKETIGSIGLVGYAMLTSPTLGDAVNLGVRLQNHAGSLLRLEVEQTESRIALSVRSPFPEPDIQPFLVEEAFGVFLMLTRTLVGDDFNPVSIDLSYPRPAYAAQYEAIFKCPIRYDQTNDVFTADAAWAEKKIATYDPLTHRQTLNYLQMAVTQESMGEELIESVERIIRRDLQQAPSLTSVAAQLCMSDRTLRRRLAENNLTYQSVLDEVRKSRALALLNNSRLSVEEIAFEVGFSDSHNFRRAFKRWTGHGPNQLRAST